MRSHVLNWLWLCFALYCSITPVVAASTRVNHTSFEASAGIYFQQKDTTVQPTTTRPVVISPSTSGKDTTGTKAKDTTQPAAASPVVITPSSDTTKPRKDTVPAAKPDSSAAKDTTKKPTTDTALILPADSNKLKKEIGQFTLKGAVKEAAGTPIPGAQVINLNTKEAVPSSVDGKFSIKASVGDTIKIASVSFAEQLIPVESRDSLKVTLSSASSGKKELKEVVVTALGIQKSSRSVGYAVEEVTGNAVQEAKEVNFVNALTGKVPGLQINSNTGSMGGSTKITMRGAKSILGDNNSLVIVDGVLLMNNSTNQPGQLNGGGGYDYGSPMQDLNPEDIDNISVLKGAAATALYGSRGGNGVLQITTKKRPETAGGIGITYSINAQVDKVYVLPDYQNQYGGGANGRFDTLYYNDHPEAFLSEQAATYDDNNGKGRYDLLPQYTVDESWGPKLEGQLVRPYWSWDKDKNNPYFGQTTPWVAQPDNVRDFYRTGYTLTNNIALSGSNDKGEFRASYGNMNQTFVLPNATLKRDNLSFNGSYKLADNLKAVAAINYSMLKAVGRPGTGFFGTNPTLQFTMYGQRQLSTEMQKRYAYEDGSQITWNRKSWDNPAVAFHNGSYWNRYMDYENDSRNRLFGFAGFDYDATKWLSFSARVFMDDYNTLEEEKTAKDYLVGGYTKRIRTSREMNYQLTANIRKNLSDAFLLNVLLGGNIMHRQWTTTGGQTVGGLMVPGIYNLNNSVQTALPIDEFYEKQINSAFATASLGYKDMLFLELTGRSDWSSTIAQENNPYFYPSASASFIFSDLLKDWKWLNFAKARVSVAAVGNDTDPYRTLDAYQFMPPFGSDPITQFQTTKYNRMLKPERTQEVEGGIEVKVLDNRIGASVTLYNRNTTDQILQLPISSASGYSVIYVNGGKVQNKGFELGLTLNPIRLKNGFRWDIIANVSRNRNMLKELNIEQYNTTLDRIVLGTDRRTTKVSVVAEVGKPLGTIIGRDYVYDASGNKIVNPNGYYKVTDQSVPIGNAYPDYVGGVTNSFTYKGFYLSGLIDFQSGGEFFSYTNLYGKKSGLLAITAANGIRENGIIVPGVTEDGRPNDVRITAVNHFAQNGGNVISKADLYDASYIYLREVKLGYNLPEAWFSKIGAQNARLSLYGRNLWLIKSNAPNVDPSNILNSSSNVQGIEGGALPSLRSYGVNLSVSF